MFKKLFNFTKKEWAYIMYDWAESAFTVTIGSFIFPILYGILMSDAGFNSSESGALYGFLATGISLVIAILAPILGTYAEYKGMKKRLFMIFFLFGVSFNFFLAFYPLDPAFIWITLILYIVAMIGYAGTNIFYDSFIVDATTKERMDSVSTTAYAFGYIGGSTIPLIFALFVLQFLPLLVSVPENWELNFAFRIAFLFGAIWWLVFSIPLIKNISQSYGIEKVGNPVVETFKRLGATLKDIKKYRTIVLFLIAYFFYIDGVHTIISMAIPFANDILGQGDPNFDATATLIPLVLLIQILAFFFAVIFSKIAKYFKTSDMLIFTILMYTGITIFAFFISTIGGFYVLGILIATSQGAIQALSRSYFGKLVPANKANEFFGFYSIFARLAAVLGPALVGIGTLVAGGQPGDMRWGILSLIALFVIGLAMFLYANKERNKEELKTLKTAKR
jgi:UMF1 family MFS transporter